MHAGVEGRGWRARVCEDVRAMMYMTLCVDVPAERAVLRVLVCCVRGVGRFGVGAARYVRCV